MARQVLADGRWFDTDKAESWPEETRFNGNNHISLATGSQWEHETLYRTAGGAWVLHHTSQWQGSTPTWNEITDAEAAAWFVKNEYDAPSVPACAEAYQALEVR